jgi:hypothetical protein
MKDCSAGDWSDSHQKRRWQLFGFSEKLRLKGMAEEDIYFARKDRELIAANRLRAEARKRDDASPDKTPSKAVIAEDSNTAPTRERGC